jgi:hypothetical protein
MIGEPKPQASSDTSERDQYEVNAARLAEMSTKNAGELSDDELIAMATERKALRSAQTENIGRAQEEANAENADRDAEKAREVAEAQKVAEDAARAEQMAAHEAIAMEDAAKARALAEKIKNGEVGGVSEGMTKSAPEKSPERAEAEFKIKELDEKISFERGQRAKVDGALEYLALTREENDTVTFGEFAREMVKVDIELSSLENRRQQIAYDSGILQEKSPSQTPEELKRDVEYAQKSQAENIRIGKGTLAKSGYEHAQPFMGQIRKNLEHPVSASAKKISNGSELMGKIKSDIKQFATEKRPIPYAFSQKSLGIGLAALKVKAFETAADAVALAEASGQSSMREVEEIIKTMDSPSRQKFQKALEYSRSVQGEYKK